MKRNGKFSFYTLLKIIFLSVVMAVIIIPLLHIVAVSFSSSANIAQNNVTIFPKGLNFKVYEYVLTDKNIFISYKNTIVYVAVGTFLSLLVTSCAAYALSKRKLVFLKFWIAMIMVSMFFSGGMIPTFLIVRKVLGLYDTMWAIILPSLVSSYNLFIMRSFFTAFPEEIEESGRIDGLNDIKIFWYMVLPVSKAVMSTIGLFYAVALWNSYFAPFLYLETKSKFPLQLILRSMLVEGTSLNAAEMSGGDITTIPEALRYATIIVSVVPIIAVYPFLQKYFVQGVMLGSIKG